MKAARICTGALIWIGLPMVALVAGGCQSKGGGVPSSSSALDVSATPSYTPASGYAPAPAQPVYDSQPVVAAAVTPAYGSAGAADSSMAGGSYTVKKGDTLYGIARAHYGDGKQWQRIQAANPGVSPQSLKVGQTITLP